MLDLTSRLDALAPLLDRFAGVGLVALSLGLTFQLLKLAAMGRVWHVILRAAYPDARLRMRDTLPPYIAGAGINSVIPAKAGLVARAMLVKRRIPGGSYETIAGTILAETLMGVIPVALLLGAALGVGFVPTGSAAAAVASPDWRALAVAGAVAAGTLAAVLIPRARRRARSFAHRLRAGVTVVTDRRALGQALAFEGLAWLLRLACTCAFLAAFGLDASPRTVLLVVIVQVLSSLVPFSPNGAGAQQGLMVLALLGTAPAGSILAFAIGMQAAIAALDVVAAAVALAIAGAPRGLLRDLRKRAPEPVVTPAG